MATKSVSTKKMERSVSAGPFAESEKAVLAQIAEYYRQKRLYAAGKLAVKPKLPDCAMQKYKDIHDKP